MPPTNEGKRKKRKEAEEEPEEAEPAFQRGGGTGVTPVVRKQLERVRALLCSLLWRIAWVDMMHVL